jgi:hypothetical protein
VTPEGRRWLSVLVIASGVAVGQTSRPATPAPPQSMPTASRESKDPFRPDPSDKESKSLLDLAKGKLSISWVDKQNAKPNPKAPAADASEHLDVMARHRVAAQTLETNEPSVRAQVMKVGLPDKSGARVLPLGRFDWMKAPLFLKPGETGKTSVICVLVATPELPLGDVKGFRVKGEFLDKNGKRAAEFNQRSVPASPQNGVFLLWMPAGDALRGVGEYDGFQFRLIEVQPVK